MARLKLPRLIARSVADAVVSRQYLRVAPGSHDALVDDVEAAVTPLLPAVAAPFLRPAKSARGTSSAQDRERAVAALAEAISERIARSNHIDDIYADDARIRREAHRAASEVLSRCRRGELALADEVASEARYSVQLDALGYVAAAAAARAHPSVVRRALTRAARRARAVFDSYDPEQGVAVFRPGADRPCLLDLEDAIASQLGALVDSGRVALPTVERLLPSPATRRPGAAIDELLAATARAMERSVRCRASCVRIGGAEIRAALTPLTSEVAEHAEIHLDSLVAAVRRALKRSAREAPAPASEQRAVSANDRAGRQRAFVPASGRRRSRDRRLPSKRAARKR